MKKLLVTCVLALALMMADRQSASAWSEFKFSAGVNMGWVGGGNRLFWGMYRSAPYPGGQDLGPFFPGIAGAANNGQYYGWPPGGGQGGYYPQGAYPPAAYAPPAPAPVPAGPMPQSSNWSYNSGYQLASYYAPAYAPTQVPSYWYGR